MMEGSGAGSVLVNNVSESGSERPKNMRIQRIRMWKQIRNVAVHVNGYDHGRIRMKRAPSSNTFLPVPYGCPRE
jgi:hypothetical protein